MKDRIERILTLLGNPVESLQRKRDLEIRQVLMELSLLGQDATEKQLAQQQLLQSNDLQSEIFDLSEQCLKHAGVALLFLSSEGKVEHQVGALPHSLGVLRDAASAFYLAELFRGRDSEYCLGAFKRAVASQQRVQLDLTVRHDGRLPHVYTVLFVPLDSALYRVGALIIEQNLPEQGQELLQKHFLEVPHGAKADFFRRSHDFLAALPNVDKVLFLSIDETSEAHLLDFDHLFEKEIALGTLDEEQWKTGQNGSTRLFGDEAQLELHHPTLTFQNERSRLYRVTLDDRGKACGLIYLSSNGPVELLLSHGNTLRVIAVRLSSEFEWYRAERKNKIGHARLESLIHDRTEELLRKNYQLQALLERQKTTEIRLAQAKEEAENASQIKNVFLASISHEIRTPLNGILGTLSILESRGIENDQARYFDILKQSSHSLLRLISDVLDFSKLEAEKLEFEMAPCSPFRTFANAIESHRVEIERKSLRVELSAGNAQNIKIFCDEVRLRQVFDNLLSNAMKFSDPGSLVLVRMRMIRNKGLYFSVRDKGIGIAKDAQKLLFKSFSRVHVGSKQKYSGTGLGLAISKSIVERMEGKIHLNSLPQKGSVFSVYFPMTVLEEGLEEYGSETVQKKWHIYEPGLTVPSAQKTQNILSLKWDDKVSVSIQSQTNALAAVESSGVQTKLPAQGRRILVAEDNEFNLILVVQMLEMLGATVVTAVDGIEAFEKATSEEFDFIFLDFFMPEMDGGEVAEKLRVSLKGKGTPVVALTANLEASEELKRYAPFFDKVLTKPVSLPAFAEYFRSVPESSKLGL
jgi:signal transduction histidine kinase/CheY-like chemotaxis protein